MEKVRNSQQHENCKERHQHSIKHKLCLGLLIGIMAVSFLVNGSNVSIIQTNANQQRRVKFQQNKKDFTMSYNVSEKIGMTNPKSTAKIDETKVRLNAKNIQEDPIASMTTEAFIKTTEMIDATKLNLQPLVPYQENVSLTIQTTNLTYVEKPAMFTEEFWKNPITKTNSEITYSSKKLILSYLDDGSESIAQANYDLQMKSLYVEDSMLIEMNITILAENISLISQNTVEIAGISFSVKLDNENWDYFLVLYSNTNPGSSSPGAIREFQNNTFGKEIQTEISIIEKFSQVANFSQITIQTFSFFFTSGLGIRASLPQITMHKHIDLASIREVNPEQTIEEISRFTYSSYINTSNNFKLPSHNYTGSMLLEKEKRYSLTGRLRIDSAQIRISFNVSKMLLPVKSTIITFYVKLNWNYEGEAIWENRTSALINGTAKFDKIEKIIEKLANEEIKVVINTNQSIFGPLSASHNQPFDQMIDWKTPAESVLLVFQENRTLYHIQYEERTKLAISSTEINALDYGAGLLYLIVFTIEIPKIYVLPIYMKTYRTSLILSEGNPVELVRWMKNTLTVSYVAQHNASTQIDQGRWVLTFRDSNVAVSVPLEAQRNTNNTRLVFDEIGILDVGEYLVSLEVYSEKYQNQILNFTARVRNVIPKVDILELNQTIMKIRVIDLRGIPMESAFVKILDKATTPTTVDKEGIGNIEIFEPLLGNQTFQIAFHDIVKEVKKDFSVYEKEFSPKVKIIHAIGVGNGTGEVRLQILIPPLFGEWLMQIPGGFEAIDIVVFSKEDEIVQDIRLTNDNQLLIKGNGKVAHVQAIITVKAPQLFYSTENNIISGILVVSKPFNQIKGMIEVPDEFKIRKMTYRGDNITGRILSFGGNQITIELWPKATGEYKFEIVLELYGALELGNNSNKTTKIVSLGPILFLVGIISLGSSLGLLYKKRLDTRIEFAF